MLDADVRQFGAMPADKALKITADVLAALEISHEMGLVHRDIKPGNVMMTKRGVVKVMDFGIARAMQSGVTSMTQTGMVVGTPQYLSPEQALGRGVDARSDLYSVGIMLFQLVTGRLPFEADSPLAIAYAHVQEEPVGSLLDQPLAAAGRGRAGRPRAEEEPERALPERRGHARRVPARGRVLPRRRRRASCRAPRPPSGAGVGSAVFPPVDQATPRPRARSRRRTSRPRRRTRTAPRPPAPSPAYGYPAAGRLPDAAARPAYSPAARPVDPAAVQPVAPDRGPASSGGGKSNRPVIIGSIVVVASSPSAA